MKNFISLLFLFFVFNSFGQSGEGYIQYSIDVKAIDTSLKTKQSVGLLRNSKMEIYYTPNQLRIDFKMGKMSESKMIIDYKKDSSVSLVSNVYGKYAVVTSTEDLQSLQMDESSSIKLMNETRKILNYTCKKAIVTSKGVETTYWYTDEINIDFRGNRFYSKILPGFPLFFSKIENGVYMEYQASNIVNKLDNEEQIFSLIIPPGYTLIPR